MNYPLDDLVKAGWTTFSGWQMLFGAKANREEYDAEMKRRMADYVAKNPHVKEYVPQPLVNHG